MECSSYPQKQFQVAMFHQWKRFIDLLQLKRDKIADQTAACYASLNERVIFNHDLTANPLNGREKKLKREIFGLLFNALPVCYWNEGGADPFPSLRLWLKGFAQILPKCTGSSWYTPLYRLRHLYLREMENPDPPLYAQISIPGFGNWLIDSNIARNLISKDREGNNKRRVGQTGNHCVYQYVDKRAGVNLFFKSNPGQSIRPFPKESTSEKDVEEYKGPLNPMHEYAVVTWQHLFSNSNQSAASTCMVMIRNVVIPRFEVPDQEKRKVMLCSRMVQVGLGVEGELVRHILFAQTTFNLWKRLAPKMDMADVLSDCLSRKFTRRVLKRLPTKYSQLSPKSDVDPNDKEWIGCLCDYMAAILKSEGGRQCKLRNREIWLNQSAEDEFRLHTTWFSWGHFVWGLAFIERYPHLVPSCHEFSDVIAQIEAVEALDRLTEYMDYQEKIDYASTWITVKHRTKHHSSWWLTSLTANLTDAKGDNYLASSRSHQFTGIDNDLAFDRPFEKRKGEHKPVVKNFLYCLPECISQDVNHQTRERFLSKEPEEWMLEWLESIHATESIYKMWVRHNILPKDLLSDLNGPLIDIPFLPPSSFVLDGLKAMRKIKECLEKVENNVRHGDLLRACYPALAAYYQKLRNLNSCPLKSIDSLYNIPPSFELLVGGDWKDNLEMETKEGGKEENYTIDKMAQQLALNWDIHRSLSSNVAKDKRQSKEEDILDRIGRLGVAYVPNLTKTFNLQKCEHLFAAIEYGKVGILSLLLHQNVKKKDEEQKITVWHVLVRSFEREIPGKSDNDVIEITKLLCKYASHLINEPNAISRYASFELVHGIQKNPILGVRILQLMLCHGLRGDLEAEDQGTVIDYAIHKKKHVAVNILMSFGFGRWLRRTEDALEYFSKGKGERESFFMWLNQQPSVGFRVAMGAISVKERPKSKKNGKEDLQYIPLIGCASGTRYLKPEIKNIILDKEHEWNAKSGVAYGRHTVLKIPHLGGVVYLTLYPELPGLEYAVESFCKHLFGPGLTSVAELFKIEIKEGEYIPVLLSQGVLGENVQASRTNPDLIPHLSQIDVAHFTEHLLTSILYHPEDGKPDNFVLVRGANSLGLPCGLLVDVDHDRAWVQPVLTEDTGDEFKHVLQLKTMIFCLDHMKTALDQNVVKKFLDIDFGNILQKWLEDCAVREKAHFELFCAKERRKLAGYPPDTTRLAISSCTTETRDTILTQMEEQKGPNESVFCLLYLKRCNDWYFSFPHYRHLPIVGGWVRGRTRGFLRSFPRLESVARLLQNRSPDDLENSPLRKQVHRKCVRAMGFPKEKPVIVSIPFAALTVARLYGDALRLQRKLKKMMEGGEELTGFDLLRVMLPTVHQFYEIAFKVGSNVVERFDVIAQKTYMRYGQENRTMTSGLHLLSSQQIPKRAWLRNGTQYDINAMMRELRLVREEYKQLQKVKNDMNEGNVSSLRTLKISSSVERVLAVTNFEHLNLQQQHLVWDSLLFHQFSFFSITFWNASLTKDILLRFLRNSRYLKHLRVIGCENLGTDAFGNIDVLCPYLSSLHLENLPKVKVVGAVMVRAGRIRKWNFSFLQKLWLISMPQLQKLYLNCENPLTSLKIKNCHPNLFPKELLENILPPIDLELDINFSFLTNEDIEQLVEVITLCKAWSKHQKLVERFYTLRKRVMRTADWEGFDSTVFGAMATVALPSTNVLDVRDTQISPQSITNWIRKCPSLKKVILRNESPRMISIEKLSSLHFPTQINLTSACSLNCGSTIALAFPYLDGREGIKHSVTIWHPSQKKCELVCKIAGTEILLFSLHNGSLLILSRFQGRIVSYRFQPPRFELKEKKNFNFQTKRPIKTGCMVKGEKIAFASESDLFVLDTSMMKCESIYTAPQPLDGIPHLCPTEDGFAFALGTILQIWRYSENRWEKKCLFSSEINALCLLENGNLISASKNKISIWEKDTWKSRETLTITNGKIDSLCLLPTGVLISFSQHGFEMWEDVNFTLLGHSDRVWDRIQVFSLPNGNLVIFERDKISVLKITLPHALLLQIDQKKHLECEEMIKLVFELSNILIELNDLSFFKTLKFDLDEREKKLFAEFIRIAECTTNGGKRRRKTIALCELWKLVSKENLKAMKTLQMHLW